MGVKMKYKFLFIIIIPFIFCTCTRTNELTETINEMQIINQADIIAKSYCKNHSNAVLLNFNERKRVSDSYIFDDMTDKERILFLRQKTTFFEITKKDELQTIFQIFLYLRNKTTEVDVIAIAYSYTSGGIDNTQSEVIIVSKQEFEELYNQISINEGKSVTSLLLAQSWKEKMSHK